MIDVRVNGRVWKEYRHAAKAASDMKCGYYKNGTFDLTQTEAAEKILKATSATDEMKAEAQAFLDGDADEFCLEWVDEKNW